MIARARNTALSEGLLFEVGDILGWRSPEPVDLMLADACFHWLEDHRALFDHLLPRLATEGTLAFQVPANCSEPSHALLRELCSRHFTGTTPLRVVRSRRVPRSCPINTVKISYFQIH
jgi:trans-aconitate 2-methyltransferase